MASDDIIHRFFDHVDANTPLYKERLGEAVAIPSVSAELDEHLADIVAMMDWTKGHIERLGGTVVLAENPVGTADRPLPPILMGSFPSDPSKKTVCVYGHLDVQPAKLEDGWDSDPFTLTERDGKLFGRGSTDDKGPALSWLWVVEAHQKLGIELPVNIKLLYEGMEEFGSEGFDELVKQESSGTDGFLNDVDFFCVSDNYWLGTEKPCITYGLRGIAYFQVELRGLEQDLHSGLYGGVVYEPMTDLMKIMSALVDSQGKILVPGVMDSVDPVTPEEETLYEPIELDVDDYKAATKIDNNGNKTIHETKKDILMARWRFPSLSLHGIEGAFSSAGAKTVIPCSVIGKFSIRLVPSQKPKTIENLVKKHIQAEFDKLGSPNKMEVTMIHGAKAWKSGTDHPNYKAAAAAIRKVFGVDPDYTREGGSIPIVSTLEDYTGMNVLLLPVGACDDMAHSQNEKYNVSNLVNAIKVLGLYLHELGEIEGPKPSDCRCIVTDDDLAMPGGFLKAFRCKCEM